MLLDALQGVGYVCASCDISPEFREFERASTTVINAYVGPLMDRYLGELERGCSHRLSIMQSNGGLLTASEARKHAVRTILSGPAGGVAGAVEIARLAGFRRALTFDMGGTSTDVALAGHEARLSTEARIDGFPVRVPMLDIHTAGAGGGSIAYIDVGGSLRVGPESAGASPGPACYGEGELPTVTDAHVVLGRIAADQLMGGTLRIDQARAERALARLGKPVDVAAKIIRIANSNMERAIRAVSVERGEDPRDFPLVAFGGCGGLHACELAESLGIRTVIIPRMAGVLSALGMLLADRQRDFSIGALGATDCEVRFRRLGETGCPARPEPSSASPTFVTPVRATSSRSPGVRHFTKPISGLTFTPIRSARRRLVRFASGPRCSAGLSALAASSRAGKAVVDYGSTTFVPPGWLKRRRFSG